MKLVRYDGHGVAVIDEGDSGSSWAKHRPSTLSRCCVCNAVKLPGSAMWLCIDPGPSRVLCDWCLQSRLTQPRRVCTCGSFKGFNEYCDKCNGMTEDTT